MLERERPQPRVLLDVGCATGRLMSIAERRDWRCEGMEADAQGAQYTRMKGLAVQCCSSLVDYESASASFGAIVMVDSLYYFADPGAQLRAARRLMAPGGCLLIRLPNRQWIVLALWVIACIIPGLCQRLRPLGLYHYVSDALFTCYLPSLRRMIADAGFRHIRLVPAPPSHGGHGLRSLLTQFLNMVGAILFRATAGKLLVSTGVVAVARAEGNPVARNHGGP